MSRLLLGLHGLPGVGKDTIADHLVAYHRFEKIGFADRLKEEVLQAYPLSTPEMFNGRTEKTTLYSELAFTNCVDRTFIHFMLGQVADGKLDRFDNREPHTPRWVMQMCGDFRRDQCPTYFIDMCRDRIDSLPADLNVVIPDVRFANEARAVLGMDWPVVYLVEVIRPGNPFAEGDTHVTNQRLSSAYLSYRITNSDTKASLRKDVDTLLARFR